MADRDHFRSLLEHMEWADALAWKSVRTVSGPASDDKLKGLLHHLHSVQWVYLHIWRGEPLQIAALDSFNDLADVKEWARRYYAQLGPFVETLDASVLSRSLEFPWAKHIEERFGSVGPVRLDDSVLQVTLHSTYHRGQIAMRVRDAAGEPELTDFVAWLWMGRPAAEWA